MSTSDDLTHSPGVGTELSSTQLSDIESVAPSSTGSPTQDWRLIRALDMIQSRPTQSVREIAFQVRLSPAHLQRLFKHQLGVNVSAVLVERRLTNAAQLLASGELSIKEIAHRVGYNHHSSFVRAFQRRYAEAPRTYRQRSFGVDRQLHNLADNVASS